MCPSWRNVARKSQSWSVGLKSWCHHFFHKSRVAQQALSPTPCEGNWSTILLEQCSIGFTYGAICSCNSNRDGHSSTILSLDLTCDWRLQSIVSSNSNGQPCFLSGRLVASPRLSLERLFPSSWKQLFLIERTVLSFSDLSSSLEKCLAAAVFPFSLSYLPICAHCLAVSWLYNPWACIFMLMSSFSTDKTTKFACQIAGGGTSVACGPGWLGWKGVRWPALSNAAVPYYSGTARRMLRAYQSGGYTCNWQIFCA